MNAKVRRGGGNIAVKDYLAQQIALSGKTQKEIAQDVGYRSPNIMTMFKTGQTRIPLNKVIEFAKSLGVDPVHFLRIVMIEYNPQTWDVIEQVIGRNLISQNESEILNIIRDTAQGVDVCPRTDEDRLKLMTLVAEWRDQAHLK